MRLIPIKGTPVPIAVASNNAGIILSISPENTAPDVLAAVDITDGVGAPQPLFPARAAEPIIGIKRIYETAEEQDLWELIGGKK